MSDAPAVFSMSTASAAPERHRPSLRWRKVRRTGEAAVVTAVPSGVVLTAPSEPGDECEMKRVASR